MEINKTMNKHAQQLGKLGGKATKAKHGKDHFKRISKMGVLARQGRCKKCGELIKSDEDSLCGNCI